MTHVRVTVPATSANLGPGFDCLGLALALHNTVEVETGADSLAVDITGEGADSLPDNESNLVVQAARVGFERAGQPMPGLRFALHNHIPPMSGLGSSSAAIVGGVTAANALLANPLPQSELIRIAVGIEGHPDNICAAMLGGLVISSLSNDGVICHRIAPPPMRVIIVTPNLHLSTAKMRDLLPTSLPLADAVHNIGRAALVVEALRTGDFDLLGRAMDDRLHVPYRRVAIPGFDAAVEAGLAAGAAAVTISGAGPSLIAFAPSKHESIAESMAEALNKTGNLTGRWWAMSIDAQGAQVGE